MAMSAFLAGCTEATLVPFERVQTLMQETQYHGKFKNTPAAFYQLYTQYGVREYYRGLSAVLMRNGPSNVIFFASREKVIKNIQWKHQIKIFFDNFRSEHCYQWTEGTKAWRVT